MLKHIFENFTSYPVGTSVGWYVKKDTIDLYVKEGELWKKIGELPNDGTWYDDFPIPVTHDLDSYVDDMGGISESR